MLTKQEAIKSAEAYLSKKYPVFKSGFFILENISEGTRYKPDGKDVWNLFDYHLTWIEFVDNTEKQEHHNIIHAKINVQTGRVYFSDIKYPKEKPKKISKEIIKKMEITKISLLQFLRKEAKENKLKSPSDIPLPISIEPHRIYQKTFLFKNDFGRFSVSFDGFVCDAWFDVRAENSELLDEKKSVEIVKNFLNRQYPDFSKRTFEIRSIFEEGMHNIEFDLTEKPKKGEVSIYQNHIRVVLNRKKHSIISYHSTNLFFRRTKSIKISAEQAVKIFKKKFPKSKNPQASVSEKLIDFKPKSVWYVYDENHKDKVEDKFCLGIYAEIDADSGKLIRIGGFECK